VFEIAGESDYQSMKTFHTAAEMPLVARSDAEKERATAVLFATVATFITLSLAAR